MMIHFIFREKILLAICLFSFSCNSIESSDPTSSSSGDIAMTAETFKLTPEDPVCKASIRGLYLVDENIAWASGSGGTVLRMTDGLSWEAIYPAGYEHLDFRDIHAFDDKTAIAMAAGDEGRLIRTEDGGISWKEVYTDLSEGIFLDGMDFHDSIGICFGDPIESTLYGAYTVDYGRTWKKSSMTGFPATLEGEAGFAASGTGIIVMKDREYTATGGGEYARVIRSMREMESDFRTEAFETPLKSGEGCGIFSMAFKNLNQGVVVGGCYLDSLSSAGNCAYTTDAGQTWNLVDSLPPEGYRSCVVYNSVNDLYLTCGRTGVDLSIDGGKSWSMISADGYFTCATIGNIAWLAGRNGKMARISW